MHSVSHDLREKEIGQDTEKKPLLRNASPSTVKKPDVSSTVNYTDNDAIPMDFRVPSW